MKLYLIVILLFFIIIALSSITLNNYSVVVSEEKSLARQDPGQKVSITQKSYAHKSKDVELMPSL